MTRAETLRQAEACVMVDRQSTHGAPEDSFALIAKFWSAFLGKEIKDYEVGILLGLMKIARMKFTPLHMDNYVDLAGYASCSAELSSKRVQSDVKSFWDGIPPAEPKYDGPLPSSILETP